MKRISLSNLLLVVACIAISLGWFIDRRYTAYTETSIDYKITRLREQIGLFSGMWDAKKAQYFEIADPPSPHYVSIAFHFIKCFEVYEQQSQEDKARIISQCEIYLAVLDCQKPSDFFGFLDKSIPNGARLLSDDEKKSMLVFLERIFSQSQIFGKNKRSSGPAG